MLDRAVTNKLTIRITSFAQSLSTLKVSFNDKRFGLETSLTLSKANLPFLIASIGENNAVEWVQGDAILINNRPA